MQKLNSIQGYKCVKEGASVAFQTEEHKLSEERTIKLAVITANDVTIYVTNMAEQFDDETGEMFEDVRLLAHVKAGFDQIEFAYVGDFILQAVGGDVWLRTYEGGNFEVGKTDLESYARIYEREEEDPLIAEFKRLARQNQRQLEYQRQLDREEFEARMRALESQKEPTNVVTPPAAPAAPAAGPAPVSPPVGAQDDNGATPPATGGTGEQPNAGT